MSATRTEAPLGQVASGVTVFDAAEIERNQQPPLADLLRGAPGRSVVANGGRGAVTSLFVRGGESNYTKVLLDGIPLERAGRRVQLRQRHHRESERVEFVRGAQVGAVRIGRDDRRDPAVHAARRPTGRTAVRVEGGSSHLARIRRRRRQGRRRRLLRRRRALHDRQRSAEQRVPQHDVLGHRVGVALSETRDAALVGRAERGHHRHAGPDRIRPARSRRLLRAPRTASAASSFDQATGALRQRATYGLRRSHQASTNLHARSTLHAVIRGPHRAVRVLRLRATTATPSCGGTTRATRPTGDCPTRAAPPARTLRRRWSTGTASGRRSRDRLANTSTPASRNNVGWTIQHQALWSRVFVTGGRADRAQRQLRHRGGAARLDRCTSRTGGRRTARRHAAQGVAPDAGSRSRRSSSRSAPSPFSLGNPELEPERSTRARTSASSSASSRTARRVELTWFDNRYRDIISTQTISFNPFTSQYFNIGLTRARGAELSGELAPAAGVLRARRLHPPRFRRSSRARPRSAPCSRLVNGCCAGRGIRGSRGIAFTKARFTRISPACSSAAAWTATSRRWSRRCCRMTGTPLGTSVPRTD